MFKLLLGRAGAGKTTAVLNRLCEASRERPQVLLVPEQMSHETERALCAGGGPQINLRAEVLSFSRLANRIFQKAGGLGEEELVESFVSGAADLVGVGLIIGISRGITVLMDGGAITDTVLYWGERTLEGAGSVSFILLVYLIYLPLSVLIPSSSGLATLSVPIVAPLGQFAGIGGSLIVTAFQSASGLVNIITPTAAVVMGGLAVGGVPYDRWVRFVWKLVLIFLLLTGVFLAVSAIL